MKKYIFTTFFLLMFPLQGSVNAHPEICYWQNSNGVRVDLSGICGVSQTSREIKTKDLQDTVQKVARSIKK